MKCLITCSLFLLCSVTAQAQDMVASNDAEIDFDLLFDIPLPGEESAKTAIQTINLNQLKGRTVTRVTAVNPPPGFDPVEDMEIPLGISLDRSVIRKAIKRLWGTGNYRNIEIEAVGLRSGGVELRVKVEMIIRLARLELSGAGVLKEREIKRALGFVSGGTIRLDQAALEQMGDQLEQTYEERGYPETHTRLRLETTDKPGKVALVVEIKEGKPARYTQITFSGLGDLLDSAYLQRKAGLKRGIIRDREKVRDALNKLEETLAKLGYLDAVIGDAVEQKAGKYSYSLTVPIKPGIKTTLIFRENRRLRKRALIKRLLGKGGFDTSPSSVKAAVLRLKNLCREKGLFHARITAARICRHKNDEPVLIPASNQCDQTVMQQDLVFKVHEGPPVEVSSARFEGNTYFSDKELKAELFAFMAEQNEMADNFSPVNSLTYDTLGTSNEKVSGPRRSRGAITPTTEPSRIYVPRQYYAAMEHLTAMYQERGFLEATVADTCDLNKLASEQTNGVKYRPLLISRDIDSDEEDAGSPCVMIGDNLTSLKVIITIQEGPQTTLGRVGVEGNNPNVFTEAKLLRSAHINSGQPYNEYDLREAAQVMKNAYRAAGYMFSEVGWKSSISRDGKIADVVFTVKEGPLAKVKRLVLQGNDVTTDALIRDRITLQKDDLITPEALSKSEQRLMQLGIFDAVAVQMQAPEESRAEKNVVIKVTESKPQYLELRGGIATVDGPRGLFEYGYKNIGGRAFTIRGRARGNYRLLFVGSALDSFGARYNAMPLLDRLEHHLMMGIGTQHLPGTSGLLGASFNVVRERTNAPAFSATRRSIILRVESDRHKMFRAEAHTGMEWTDIELPEGATALQGIPQFQRWARMPEGKSTFIVPGLTLTFDLRDEYFNPTQGIFVTLGGDLVRSLASDETKNIYDPDTGKLLQTIDKFSFFVRMKASISGYIPLVEKKLILALSASVGYIFHLAQHSATWADRYFYIGGVPTLRGFAQDTLVPNDIYKEWKHQLNTYGTDVKSLLESYGGESMLIFRAELRYPIIGPLSGTLFSEAGNLWRTATSITLNPSKLRPVSGVGLRLATPVGPVSFDLGVNLNRRPHEDRAAGFFSIGSAF